MDTHCSVAGFQKILPGQGDTQGIIQGDTVPARSLNESRDATRSIDNDDATGRGQPGA
jgi:hypothetical protein